MPAPRKFLIIDDNSDSRFLLVKTLLRKFPQAVLQECQDADAAIGLVKTEKLDAVVAHRAAEVDGLTLIRMLRQASATVPIVMVSGFDRSKEAVLAGATCFLSYDAWLRIGTVVADLLTPPTGIAFPKDDRSAAGSVSV